MKIKSVKINGFGIFSNVKIENLSPGLSVFTGPNESGKSTFMRFIRSCLFGMKGKRGPIDEPLRGGRHGGTLDINLADSSSQKLILSGRKLFVQDEQHEKILSDEGPPWQGLGRDLFERVFCLGLEDLSWGGSSILDEEYVKNRLFSATAGLGEVSLTDVFSSLSEEMGKFLKTRSNSSSILGDLGKRIQEIDNSIAELGNSEEDYGNLKNSRSDLENRIQELTLKIETTRDQLKNYKRIEDLIEPWNSLKNTLEEEKKLSLDNPFPSMWEHRYLEIKKQLESLKVDISGKNDLLKEKKSEQTSLDIKYGIFKLEEAIEKLREERAVIAGFPERIALMKGKMEEKGGELFPLLKEISPLWDVSELKKVNLTDHTLKEAYTFTRKSSEFESRVFSSREILQSLIEEKERTLEDYQRIRENILEYYDEIPDKAELEARVSDMEELRDLVGERNQLFDRISSLEKFVNEGEERQNQIDLKIKKISPPMSGKGVFSIFLILFAAAVSAFAFAGTGPGIFTSVISSLLMAGLFTVKGLQKKRYDRQKGDMEAELSVLKEKQDDNRDSLSGMVNQLDSMDTRIKKLAGSFDITLPETEQDIQGFRFSLKRIFSRLRAVMDLLEELEKTHTDLQRRARLVEEKEIVCLGLEKEREELVKEWRKWLNDHNLPPDTRFSSFSRLEQNVKSARRILTSIEEDTHELERTMEDYRIKDQEVESLFSQLGLQVQVNSSTVTKIDMLVSLLRENRELLNRKENLQENINNQELDLTTLGKTFSDYEAERQGLLESAGAGDEEEFFRRSEESRMLEELRQRSVQFRSRLSGIAGDEKILERLLAELEKMGSLKILSTIETLGSRLDTLEQDGASLHMELGAVENRIRDLSFDRTGSQLIQEKEFLLSEADRASRNWLKLALTRRMLEKAMEKYEIERQPEVVNLADSYMRIVTGNRYGLLSSLEDRRIVLRSVSGDERKEQVHWSSGLADQAFICIRLALAVVFASISEPLPLVLDDIHLRFDHSRQQGLARVLLELSRQHQVLFFSCSPFFQRMLGETLKEGTPPEIAPQFYSLSDGKIFEDSLPVGL